MKRYEITYMENGKTETIDVYGFKNFETFVDENEEFIDIMHVEELDIQRVTHYRMGGNQYEYIGV